MPKDVAADEPAFPVGVKDILETTGSDASGSDESEHDRQEKTMVPQTKQQRLLSEFEVSRSCPEIRNAFVLGFCSRKETQMPTALFKKADRMLWQLYRRSI